MMCELYHTLKPVCTCINGSCYEISAQRKLLKIEFQLYTTQHTENAVFMKRTLVCFYELILTTYFQLLDRSSQCIL